MYKILFFYICFHFFTFFKQLHFAILICYRAKRKRALPYRAQKLSEYIHKHFANFVNTVFPMYRSVSAQRVYLLVLAGAN